MPTKYTFMPALCILASIGIHGCDGLETGQFLQNLPWTRHVIDDSFKGADGVRLADINDDGFMDITTAWEEGGLIRVYIHPGPEEAKKKWPAVTVGRVGNPEDAVFVDLDNDRAVDVVSSCEGDTKSIYIHWAPQNLAKLMINSAWHTQALPAAEKKQKWMFCLPMQVDGKNGIDLVAGAKGDNAQIGWFESPANPRQLDDWQWHPLYEAGWIMSLIAHDMDGDGDLDILASDRKGSSRGCLWLENPGPAMTLTSPWPEHRIGSGDKEFMFLTLADLNQDGLLDVLAAVRSSELVYHQRIAENPIRWKSSTIQLPESAGTGKAVAVGDINQNGSEDIVFTCENAGNKSGTMWMSSTNNINWDSHDISGSAGIKYDLAQLLDMDADGDLDVLTCEEKSNLGVIWYENPLHP